jgi:hypothetical protein
VRQGIAEGRFRDGLDNPDLIAQTLWAAVHGVIALHIAKECDKWVEWQPIEERINLMLDASLRGLVKEAK